MMQNIRKNSQGIVAKVVVGLIVGSFALFGVQSILVGGGVNFVAKVDGEGIEAFELQQAINIQKRRLLSALGDQIDPAMLDDNRLQGPALESLIREKLFTLQAEKNSLAISENVLNTRITDMPEFSIDGNFSTEVYRNVLAQNGYSPGMFKQLLERESLARQLRTGLAASEFSTPLELNLGAKIIQEKRDIRYLMISRESFRSALTPGPEQIQTYYDTNIDSFMAPEAINLEYIELQLQDFYTEIAEDELQLGYQRRLSELTMPEERRVSHILMDIEGDMDESMAMETLVEIKGQLDAGADFAELAKEHSQDIGSAEFGGDLGFTQGDAFPEAMEAAIAGLDVNQVSEPIETDAGWHLVQVTEIATGDVPAFEDVRDEILEQLQAQSAGTEIVKQVEKLRDLAFNADDLASPAAAMDFTVKQSERLERGSGAGLFRFNGVEVAAFSTEVRVERHNSAVLEVAPNHYIALRLVEHFPSVARPLTEVSPQIIEAVITAGADVAAYAKAEELLAKLHAGSSIEQLALDGGYDWQVELALLRETSALPPAAMDRVFQLPADNSSSQYDYVATSGGDVVIFELDRVVEGDLAQLTPQPTEQLKQRLSGESGALVDQQYLESLRDRADIEVM
jgi:peptidyl-prolyl cis-trans isomerase D